MYYLQDANMSSRRYGSMEYMYYMDTLPGPGQVQGPWADVWRAAVTTRFNSWFGALAELGGQVDIVLSDFEMGEYSSAYAWSHQPTADGSPPVVK